jgi:thiol-disulfide isomerase/thioredoxin
MRPPVVLMPICLFALCLQLGVAFGEPMPANEALAELEHRRRLEQALLHLPIDRMVLGSLQVWDKKTGQLRLRVPGESFDDSRPVLILHLWATWCDPCKEEMPLWRELADRMSTQFASDVRIVHIAMQSETQDMASFVQQLGSRMPFETKFFDDSERLVKLLRPVFKVKKGLPTLPITLWLGPARTVRQAFVGAISGHEAEVMDATERLLGSIRYLRDASKKSLPKDEESDVFTNEAPCHCPCICNQ